MLPKIPNILTSIRILLTPLFAYFLIQEEKTGNIIAISIYFIASATDWLDGYLARRINHTTRLGQFLDPVADKVLVSTALFLFAYLDYIYLWMVFVIVFRDFALTGLRIYALQNGRVIITSSFAKWKTFIQMGFVFAMLIYFVIPDIVPFKLTYTFEDYFYWPTQTALIVVLLTVASGIHYIIYNMQHLTEIYNRIMKFWLQ
jgi:CDP-diacylglycerol--glycerol-3-phosphate 3-phosphatidyltransferase